jgi:hypothetical protein
MISIEMISIEMKASAQTTQRVRDQLLSGHHNADIFVQIPVPYLSALNIGQAVSNSLGQIRNTRSS